MTPFPQIALPLVTLAPHSNETTSREAARSMGPSLERLELVVAAVIGSTPGGACAFEIERDADLSGNTVRPRIVALKAKGLIRDSGRTRLTSSGRRAAVWVMT